MLSLVDSIIAGKKPDSTEEGTYQSFSQGELSVIISAYQIEQLRNGK